VRRLVIRPGAIGDCIVSLPAIEALRPAEIWAPSANLPLLSHLAPTRSIATTGLDLLEIEGQDSRARRQLASFDEIVSWYGTARPEFRAAVEDLPFRFHAALPDVSGRHAVDFYLRQVGAPLGATPHLPWRWRPRGFAAIHPFSGSPRKNWPLDHFRRLAASLPLRVEWCAGPVEPLEPARRFDSLDLLAGWLATASLYVGNDSGISHLAAACGVPVLAIFQGASDPAVWAPRGVRAVWLDRPSVEEAVRACNQLISQ
jgi:ADP-heptose:LPS heptosyltransferase